MMAGCGARCLYIRANLPAEPVLQALLDYGRAEDHISSVIYDNLLPFWVGKKANPMLGRAAGIQAGLLPCCAEEYIVRT